MLTYLVAKTIGPSKGSITTTPVSTLKTNSTVTSIV